MHIMIMKCLTVSQDSFCHSCEPPMSCVLVDNVDREVDSEPAVKLQVDESWGDECSLAVDNLIRAQFLVKEQRFRVDDFAYESKSYQVVRGAKDRLFFWTFEKNSRPKKLNDLEKNSTKISKNSRNRQLQKIELHIAILKLAFFCNS